MPAIDPVYLLAAAVAMVGIEVFFPSFFFFWMGMGFGIIAGISALYPFENGLTQVASALVLGLMLAFVLRKKTAELALKATAGEEEKSHAGGLGVIENGRIKFDGTYWKCDDDLSGYGNGAQVDIVIKDNKAHLVTEESPGS